MNLTWVWVTTFSLVFISSSWSKNVTYQEVLEAVTKGCSKSKKQIFLTKEQKKKIEGITGNSLHSSLALKYEAECSGEKIQVYIDSHIVRTLNETLLLILTDNKLKKIKLASFMEPSEYIPPPKWLESFNGKQLGKKFNLGQDVDTLSGATLTSQAVFDAAKKVLAIERVIADDK